MRLRPGRPYPLGATWDGLGVNFAIYSDNAERIELCLFDSPESTRESHWITLSEQTDMVWHCYLLDVRPGQLYGYRVHGPYLPSAGHRFNPHKIVLDPYARAIGRGIRWADEMFGYPFGEEDDVADKRDNAPFAPLAAVVDPTFEWGDDRPPRTPWHNTIIYEAHVKGLTRLHPDVPDRWRGTYLGLTTEAAIRHLKDLGITAVELMPVHHHANDRHLVEKGLTNYWGYNTLSYFAPDIRYSVSRDPQEAVREFKTMVRALHAADIEVILDVVYNHTAEGNEKGPTLSFRGIDNAGYYRLHPQDPRFYMDFTGCGNTLNMMNPRVLQLIMDSLRYWIQEMHVDGFRFDLASALARELFDVDRLGAFFDIIQQDPVISRVKLIAEPWDLGAGGYQVGNFPVLWAEWNGKYRDNVRRFWKGDGGVVNEFATRLCGSSDLYETSGRKPHASVNFVTCHDGFTMRDMVSYNDKHNLANGEDNRDGADDNNSWNCGVEGLTSEPSILALRARQLRNMMATLLLSQGVPMLLAGDEIMHTQGGNNNAYCQDNEIGWVSWMLTDEQREFLRFTRRMIGLRKKHPVLRRRTFFQGRMIRGSDVKDLTWIEPGGHEMTDESWNLGFVQCLGVRLDGTAMPEMDEDGSRVVGETLLLLFNAHHEAIDFTLFKRRARRAWRLEVDTARLDRKGVFPGGRPYRLEGRSVAVFRLVRVGAPAG